MTSNNRLISFLSFLTLLTGAITGIFQCTDQGREFWKTIKGEDSGSEHNTVDLSGDWKMTFNFARCSNPEFANKNFECYYDLKLFQSGNKVTGNGAKHSEKFEGKFKKYAHDFPIRVEGVIKNNELVANLFEKNSLDEVTGVMTIPLNNKWIFKGVYDASGKNCSGDIKMERNLPKPNG